jgi:hypothetical protein
MKQWIAKWGAAAIFACIITGGLWVGAAIGAALFEEGVNVGWYDVWFASVLSIGLFAHTESGDA